MSGDVRWMRLEDKTAHILLGNDRDKGVHTLRQNTRQSVLSVLQRRTPVSERCELIMQMGGIISPAALS